MEAVTEPGAPGGNWTVPNVLSLLRLVLLGLFLVALFGHHDRALAVAFLGVAGATDFLDGFVARRFNQVSELGKILDPTVDRIVLATAVIAIVAYGAIPSWLAGVVLGRESLVALAAFGLAARGVRRIDVRFIGKAGTFGLMWSFPVLLFGHAPGAAAHAAATVGWVILWPSLALSLAAVVVYVPDARRALLAVRTGPGRMPGAMLGSRR